MNLQQRFDAGFRVAPPASGPRVVTRMEEINRLRDLLAVKSEDCAAYLALNKELKLENQRLNAALVELAKRHAVLVARAFGN